MHAHWSNARQMRGAPRADIEGFLWSKTSRGCQLGVQRAAAPVVQFLGFRDDVSARRRMLCYHISCKKGIPPLGMWLLQDLKNLREVIATLGKDVEVCRLALCSAAATLLPAACTTRMHVVPNMVPSMAAVDAMC